MAKKTGNTSDGHGDLTEDRSHGEDTRTTGSAHAAAKLKKTTETRRADGYGRLRMQSQQPQRDETGWRELGHYSGETPPTCRTLPPVETSHDDLLRLISQIDAVPDIQTVLWIPSGADRRYAAVR